MRKLSNEEFIQRIINVHGNKYQPLEKYINTRTNLLVLCKKCNKSWSANPKTLMQGIGCPECGKEKAKNTVKWHISQDKFLKKINKIYGNKLSILSLYTKSLEPITVKCNYCNIEWVSKPYYLLKGHGCKICGHKITGLKTRKSEIDFINEINIIHDNTIQLMEPYTGSKKIIKAKCKICNHEWLVRAASLRSRGCPKCCQSKGEHKINSILIKNNIKFKSQFKFNDLLSPVGGKLIFDFAIFNKNNKLSHLIEYDGEGHYKPIELWGGQARLEKYKQYDSLKNQYCKKNKIKLIRIPYWQFNNINLQLLLGG